jgi:6-phosphogluconolactonase
MADSGSLLYVGSFTRFEPNVRGNAEGIHVGRWDPATGAVRLVGEVSGVDNPSFLAVHPSRRWLYSVNAVSGIDGHAGGAVSAFSIDPASGSLTLLNRQDSMGDRPAHVSVDATGRYAFAANYGSGSIAMLPIRSDGSLAPASDWVQHVGSSVVAERQAGPHAHSLTVDPTNRFALVCDLGIDRVLVYRLDLERGKLIPNDPPGVAVAPGSGPRHLDFHPNGKLVYVINEIASTLTAFAWDAENGTLAEIETVSTLPAGWVGQSATADVHVHPNGRFVYGSNRGHDSIASFRTDPATGRLEPVGHAPTGGQVPRNFLIDPPGAYLLAANERSDTVVTFRIDQATGQPSPTGHVAAMVTPTCLKLA